MTHNPAYPDTENTIGIDLDGVIHNNDKGFHDGTVYGEPVNGAKTALAALSQGYKLIIYTVKARADRPSVEWKTGVQLIWEWLEKWELDEYITDVTAIKPPAKYYIDDRAIEFTTWSEVLKRINDG
jgi:hypothetical protein